MLQNTNIDYVMNILVIHKYNLFSHKWKDRLSSCQSSAAVRKLGRCRPDVVT